MLNCVYKKSKPELQVIISMEDAGRDAPAAAVKAAKSAAGAPVIDGAGAAGDHKARPSPPLATWLSQANVGDNAPPTHPDAVLGHDGVYQIGHGMDIFVLSVTVAGAADLTELVDPGITVLDAFHFRYSLLGNPVATEAFGSLAEPSFATERCATCASAARYLQLPQPIPCPRHPFIHPPPFFLASSPNSTHILCYFAVHSFVVYCCTSGCDFADRVTFCTLEQQSYRAYPQLGRGAGPLFFSQFSFGAAVHRRLPSHWNK